MLYKDKSECIKTILISCCLIISNDSIVKQILLVWYKYFTVDENLHKEDFSHMSVLSALAAISELIDIQSVLETARISAQKKKYFAIYESAMYSKAYNWHELVIDFKLII